MEKNYERSVFDQALQDSALWVYHLHGRKIIHAQLIQNDTYDVRLLIEDDQTDLT